MNQPGKNTSFDTNMFFFLQKETRQEYWCAHRIISLLSSVMSWWPITKYNLLSDTYLYILSNLYRSKMILLSVNCLLYIILFVSSTNILHLMFFNIYLWYNIWVILMHYLNSGLDSSSSLQCVGLLRDIARSGRTVKKKILKLIRI
jgi:hypothetical protein